MITEVKDNSKIESLIEATDILNDLESKLFGNHGINIGGYAKKIQANIDNAIKKERIAILEAEISKLKKGDV